jgi:hypothetical protein
VQKSPLWALCGHAAVQRETQFQVRLNVGFQCRGMVGSHLQIRAAFRPYCQSVLGAALVTIGQRRPSPPCQTLQCGFHIADVDALRSISACSTKVVRVKESICCVCSNDSYLQIAFAAKSRDGG